MKTNELMLNGIILQSFGSDNVAHEAEWTKHSANLPTAYAGSLYIC